MIGVCVTFYHLVCFFLPVQEPQIQIDIPHMDDLLKDINDGCCLATVVSFYCPNSLRVQGMFMKPVQTVAYPLPGLPKVPAVYSQMNVTIFSIVCVKKYHYVL